MALFLRFGVIDLPYTNGGSAKRLPKGGKATKRRRPAKRTSGSSSRSVSTFQVAQWLENRYHIFEIFWELHEDKIRDVIALYFQLALDRYLQTGVLPNPIFPQEGLGEVQKMFQDFISLRGMDGIQPGVPTRAAQRGYSARLKRFIGSPRASFRDSGLFVSSARIWVDGP